MMSKSGLRMWPSALVRTSCSRHRLVLHVWHLYVWGCSSAQESQSSLHVVEVQALHLLRKFAVTAHFVPTCCCCCCYCCQSPRQHPHLRSVLFFFCVCHGRQSSAYVPPMARGEVLHCRQLLCRCLCRRVLSLLSTPTPDTTEVARAAPRPALRSWKWQPSATQTPPPQTPPTRRWSLQRRPWIGRRLRPTS